MKIYRIGCILLLFISLFFLGYYRVFFFNTIEYGFTLILTHETSVPKHKFSVSLVGLLVGIGRNYLWFASLLYVFCFALHAAAFVWFIYQESQLVLFTLSLYTILIVSCFIFIMLGNALHNSDLGYGVARHIRNLMESPFFIIFLIPATRLGRAFHQPQPQ